jgi:hypothetical protein
LRRTLGVDVDSTIWDLTEWVCEAVLDVTGERLDPESTTTWTRILDVYGEEAAMEVYDRVLSPGRVHEREPYPGSVEVLHSLQEERGIEVHFITRNWDPEVMRLHLKPWLRRHFGSRVELSVTSEDKLDILQEIGAFGMVDDRPETIRRVADSGLWAATIIQPWNRELLASYTNVYGFTSWQEFPHLLPPAPLELP